MLKSTKEVSLTSEAALLLNPGLTIKQQNSESNLNRNVERKPILSFSGREMPFCVFGESMFISNRSMSNLFLKIASERTEYE
jgi:hypothetical protein